MKKLLTAAATTIIISAPTIIYAESSEQPTSAPQLKNQLMVLEEKKDSAKREQDELKSRITDLKNQQDISAQLVEHKDAQINELKAAIQAAKSAPTDKAASNPEASISNEEVQKIETKTEPKT